MTRQHRRDATAGGVVERTATFMARIHADDRHGQPKGAIRAVVSTYGSDDMIRQWYVAGSFREWIDGFNRLAGTDAQPIVPMMLEHNAIAKVGRWTSFEERAQDIVGYGLIHQNTTIGRDAYVDVRENGMYRAVSAGTKFYMADCEALFDSEGRFYKEKIHKAGLREASLTYDPANAKAVIEEVHSGMQPNELRRAARAALQGAGFTSNEITGLFNRGFPGLVGKSGGARDGRAETNHAESRDGAARRAEQHMALQAALTRINAATIPRGTQWQNERKAAAAR